MSSTDPNLDSITAGRSARAAGDTGMDANLRARRGGRPVRERPRPDHTTGQPANGDRYHSRACHGRVGGKTNQIAVRIADAWEYHVPKIGWLCYVEDEAKLSAYKSTGWSAGLRHLISHLHSTRNPLHEAGFAFLETAATEPEQQPALVENMPCCDARDFDELLRPRRRTRSRACPGTTLA